MLNTFKACILSVVFIGNKKLIIVGDQLSVIGTSLYAWNIGRISCFVLMAFTLKHWQCIAVNYLHIQFHPAIWWGHFFGIDLFWWWFTGYIGYKFPYLVVGPEFLLLFLLGQCCPLDRYVKWLMHIESIIEGFVIIVEDTFVKCYFLK